MQRRQRNPRLFPAATEPRQRSASAGRQLTPELRPVGLSSRGSRPGAVEGITLALLMLVVVQVTVGPAVMSLGTDEAWVLNGLRSLLEPRVPDLSTELISSNGGLFAIASIVLEWIAPGSIVVHKLLSVSCLFGAWFVSLRLVRRFAISFLTKGWTSVVISPLLMLPGLVDVGTAALGTSCAILLLVSSVTVWTDDELSTVRKVLGAGVMFGLAVGSRLDVALFAPAFFVSALFFRLQSRRFDWSVLPMLTVAAVLIVLNSYSQTWSAVPIDLHATAGARGFANWYFDYPKLLNQFSTGLSLFAPAVAAAIVVATWWPRTAPSRPEGEHRQWRQLRILQSMLLVGGVCMGLGWLFRAPIPHLRYLWPTLFCFALLGSLVMAGLLDQALRGADARRILLCHIFASIALAGAVAGNMRALINADSDILSWEWSHEMAYDYFRRFVAKSDQASAAQFVTQLDPASTTVYSAVPFALRYLARRAVVDMVDGSALRRVTPRQGYIVLTPINGALIEMSTEGRQWISDNTKLVAQFGRYSIYKVEGVGVELPPSVITRRTSYSGHPLSSNWFGR